MQKIIKSHALICPFQALFWPKYLKSVFPKNAILGQFYASMLLLPYAKNQKTESQFSMKLEKTHFGSILAPFDPKT